MKGKPYFSVNEINKPPQDRVFHTYDDCQSGREIPQEERQDGRSNYRKCKHCERRDS